MTEPGTPTRWRPELDEDDRRRAAELAVLMAARMEPLRVRPLDAVRAAIRDSLDRERRTASRRASVRKLEMRGTLTG